MILGLLGYLGMNAAGYVAMGAAQANGEAKGKAPINPLLKFILNCIFLPALIFRKILPIEGTENWRKKFKKQVRRKQNKFETRDCEPTVTKPMDITPEKKADVDALIKEGKYKEAMMALNPKLDEKQATMMADQFKKYVTRYRVNPDSITAEKLFDLTNNPKKAVSFNSNSSYNKIAPELSGSGLFQRCTEEVELADRNRLLVLNLRKVISDNKSLSRDVRKKLNEMLDRAQELYIDKHVADFTEFYDDFRELAAIDGLTADNPEFKRVEGIVQAKVDFKERYNSGIYETMDVAAGRTGEKDPATLDDKEALLLELNKKLGKSIANEYYDDYRNSVTKTDKELAVGAIKEYDSLHTPTIESIIDSVTKLVVMNQYREAIKDKTPEQAQEIARAMGISEDMIKDDKLFNNQDVYDHVRGEDLHVLMDLELNRKYGNAAEVARLEAERDRMFSEKFAALDGMMAEDFEGKVECEALLKTLKDMDKEAQPVQLLLELTQLELVIEKAKKITRDVDLSKDKADAIKELQEKFEKIATTLTADEVEVAKKEMEAYYAAINGATTKEGILAEKVKAETYLDKLALSLDEYKTKAMEELTAYAGVDALDPEVAAKVTPVLENGLESIRTCANKEEVDNALIAAKEAIDKEKIRTEEPELTAEEREAAYQDVVKAFEEVKGELTPESEAAGAKLLEDAKAALFNEDIKTKEALDAEKGAWITKVNSLEKKKPIDLNPLKEAAIRELSDLYVTIRGTLEFSDIPVADEKVSTYKATIRNATTEEEINATLAEAKEYLMNLNQTLAQYKENLKQQLREFADLGSIEDASKRAEVETLLNEGLADIGYATSKAEANACFESAKLAITQAKTRNKEDEITQEDRKAAYEAIVAAYNEISDTLSEKGKADGTALLANAEKAVYSPFVFKKEELEDAKAKYIEMIEKLEKKRDIEDGLTQADRDAAYAEIEQAVEKVQDELTDKGVKDSYRILFKAEMAIKDAVTKEDLEKIKADSLAEIDGLERKAPEITQEDRDAAYNEIEAAVENITPELTEKGVADSAKLLEEARAAVDNPAVRTREGLDRVISTYMSKVLELDRNKEPELTQEEKDAAYAEVEKAVNDVKSTLSEDGVLESEVLLEDARRNIDAAKTKEELDKVKAEYIAKVAELEKKPELTQEEKDAAFAEVEKAVNEVRPGLSEKGNADADALLTEAREKINAAKTKEELDVIQTEYVAKVADLEKKPELTQEEKDAAFAAVEKAVNEVRSELSEKGIADADALLTEAREKINAATTKEELDVIQTEYVAKVANLEKKPELTQEEKDAAFAEVEKAVNDVRSELSEKGNTDADALLTEAKEKINAATTKEELEKAKSEYVGRVAGLEKKPDLTKFKDDAIKEVNKAILDVSSELTNKAISSAKGIQQEAEKAINAADSIEAINAAKENALKEIEALERKPSVDVKQTYKDQIDALYEKYKSELEQLEQKNGANYGGKKAYMTKAKNSAYANIDKASSVEELEKIVKDTEELFKTQITKAQTEQFVTITVELDGKTTTIAARNKGGVTKVSFAKDGISSFTISPAVQDLTSEASKQLIKERAEAHRRKVIENTRPVEGEIKP